MKLDFNKILLVLIIVAALTSVSYAGTKVYNTHLEMDGGDIISDGSLNLTTIYNEIGYVEPNNAADIQAKYDKYDHIIIPCGTYNLSSTLQVNRSNTVIEGSGVCTILQADPANDVIQVGDGTNYLTAIKIINLKINPSSVCGSNSGRAIYHLYTKYATYDNLNIVGTCNGIELNRHARYNSITNSEIHTRGYGVHITSDNSSLPSQNNIISDNKQILGENSSIIIGKSSSFTKISNNALFSNSSHTVIYGVGSNEGQGLIFSNNMVGLDDTSTDNTHYGLHLNGADFATVTGNHFEGKGSTIRYSYGIVQEAGSKNHTVSGNTFRYAVYETNDLSNTVDQIGNIYIHGSKMGVGNIPIRNLDTDTSFVVYNGNNAFLFNHDGSNLDIYVSTSYTSNSGWTDRGSFMLDGSFRLAAIATAPATCVIGQVYFDTSGAYCACTSTNTWENTVGTGTCA